MKIKFVYSNIYFRSLNRHKSVATTWDKVKSLGNSFEKRYSSEIIKIPSLIEKVSSKKFNEKELECYLIDWAGPSFSNPLTLKVRKDPLLMLVILTHELIHHVTGGKITPKKHQKINDLTEEVIKKLGLKAEDQMAFLRKVI